MLHFEWYKDLVMFEDVAKYKSSYISNMFHRSVKYLNTRKQEMEQMRPEDLGKVIVYVM